MATLPADDEFAPGLEAYFATAGRSEDVPFVQMLLGTSFATETGAVRRLSAVLLSSLSTLFR